MGKINDKLLIDIYHELLINDLSIMRGNYPAFVVHRPGKSKFIYYLNEFEKYTNTSRVMSPLITVFSIILGIIKSKCGSIAPGPNITIYPKDIIKANDKCSKEALVRFARELGFNNVKDAIIHVIDLFEQRGLLYINLFPENGKHIKEDNIWPDEYLLSNVEDLPNEINISAHRLSSLKCFVSIKEAIKNLEPIITLKDLVKILNKLNTRYGVVSGNNKNILYGFKTAHGEFIRLASHTGSLPLNKANYESIVLPFIQEPRVLFEHETIPRTENATINYVRIDSLVNVLEEYFELSKIHDYETREKAKKLTRALISALKNSGYNILSNYQYKMLKLAFKKAIRNNVLILLAAPTGSGKTIIFTIYMLAKLLKAKLYGKDEKVLIIYPRKSLARDQLARLIRILHEFNSKVDYVYTLKVFIRDDDSLKEKGKPISLRGIKIKDFPLYHEIINNNYNVYLRIAEDRRETINWIFDVKEYSLRNANILNETDIVITNMHMLTRILNNLISGVGNSIWESIITHATLLVIDEAHIYTDFNFLPLASITITKLLFKKLEALALREGVSLNNYSNIEKLLNDLDFDIVLSSATMSNREFFKLASSSGETQAIRTNNILGVLLIPLCANIEEQSVIPEELREFTKVILGDKFYGKYENQHNIIYLDYWTSLICRENGTEQNRRKHFKFQTSWRITAPSIVFPVPLKSSHTSLLETWLTIIHWSLGLRKKERKRILKQHSVIAEYFNPSAIIFIDNKDTISTVIKWLTQRQILDAKDHADRVLLTPLYPAHISFKRRRVEAQDQITKALLSYMNKEILLILWSSYFRDYQHVHLYYPYALLRGLKLDTLDLSNFLKKHFEDISNLCNDINNYAEKLNDLIIQGTFKSALENILKAYSKGEVGSLYYIWHHADLNKATRALVEEKIKSGDVLTVTSTSTLEVGVDMPNLTIIVQYGATTTTAELQQRFGRGGRDKKSLFVSLGLLVLRNTGQDVYLLVEENAIDYVYNLFIPPLSDPRKDRLSIIRQLSPIVASDRRIDFENTFKPILLIAGYSTEGALDIIGKLEEIHDMFNAQMQIIKRIMRNIEKNACSYLQDSIMSIPDALRDDSNKEVIREIIEELKGSNADKNTVKEIENNLLELMNCNRELKTNNTLLLYYLRLLEKTVDHLIKLKSYALIHEPSIYDKVSELYRITRSLLTKIINVHHSLYILSIPYLKIMKRKQLEEYLENYIKHSIYPSIPSIIGEYEEPYILLDIADMEISAKDVKKASFDQIARRSLQLKNEGG